MRQVQNARAARLRRWYYLLVQQSLWKNRTNITDIRSGHSVIQTIADSLQMFRPIPRHPPEDLSAGFEFVYEVTLPQHMISLPAHYTARIRDAIDEDRPNSVETPPVSVTPVRALNDTELRDLTSGSFAPFAIGDKTEIAREVWAAGNLYWASLVICMTHLGEAIIGDSPVVIIEPSMCVRVRPRPDDDSTSVIRESLLKWLNQEVERQSTQLKRSVIADAFPSGEGRVPTNPIIDAGLIALIKGGRHARALQDGFSEYASGRPTFVYEPTQAKTILVYPTLDDSSTGQIVAARVSLVQRLRRLLPNTQRP